MTEDKMEDGEAWLRVVLALRVNQLANGYEDYAEFVKQAGLSRATLYQIRKGQGNVTLETIGKLAANLGISVWSLFSRQDSGVADDLTAFGLSYEEVKDFVEHERRFRKDYQSFQGVKPVRKGAS